MAPSWTVCARVGVVVLLGASCTGGGPEPSETAEATDQSDTEGLALAVDPDAYTLVADGVLTVCADVPLPPFSFEDAETASGYGGFDLDLVEAVAAGLGLDVAIEDVTFEAITSGAVFAEGRCDVAASALTASDEWERHLAFSAPYYEVKQSLVMSEDADPTELAAAGGMRLGVQAGMPAQDFLADEAPQGAEVVVFDNTTDLLAALDIGDIDAVVLNLPTGTAWVAADVGVSVVETFVTDDTYVIAIGVGREDGLLQSIDEELARLREDGTRDRLLADHFALPLDGGAGD